MKATFSKKRFEWQNGYGAFAISRAHRERVINYINNQESHHKKESFRSEYMEFLKHHEMEVPIEFLFEFVD
jgi:putative transposase